jgi:SPP1 family predicted phage head-tail adaptor
MNIGQLDREIKLLAYTETHGPSGGVIRTEVVIANLWAKVVQISGYERYASDRVIGSRGARFTIWFRNDITLKHKIEYDGQKYDVTGIKEIGRHDALEISAEVMDSLT